MKLKLHPDKAGYAVQLSNGEVLEVQLDGGAPRIRADILNANIVVDVQWITHADGYDYLNAFYRYATRRGSLPFTMDMILEGAAMAEYTAQFRPNTFKLSQQSGGTYYVSAQLSVTPVVNEDQDTTDAATITAFETNYPYQV